MYSELKYMEMDITPECRKDSFSYELPELPGEVFEIMFLNSNQGELLEMMYPDYPLADSEIFEETNIISAKKLTHGEDVKEIFLLELPSHGREYEPGDTIGIIPQNQDTDLHKLFEHLKITNLVHDYCRISQKKTTVKPKLKPVFVDRVITLYHIFKNYIDIRCLPKKSLIRLMVEYTEDEKETEILRELCSRGAKYESEILQNNKTFLELLISFPNCCPPVIRLLENLPQLQARSYSIASSPLSSEFSLKIVFTVVQSVINGMVNEGICTGMLKSLINEYQRKQNNVLVKMFYRKAGGFRLPKEDIYPLILIGPGSGIAPFIGFLEHRRMQKSAGKVWLFYGCRYKMNDYLFRSELENYLNCGALSKLIVSFSREPGQCNKYVQDCIRNYGQEICDMIIYEKALIYVCGDAKGLRKDVMNALISVIEEHTDFTFKEATNFIKVLQKEKRYLQDVWL